MRYIVVEESTGTWCVFDRVFSLAAQMDGLMLVGLTRHAAEQEASKANEVRLRWRPTGESLRSSQIDVHTPAVPVASRATPARSAFSGTPVGEQSRHEQLHKLVNPKSGRDVKPVISGEETRAVR